MVAGKDINKFLQEDIDPNAPKVQFVSFECRICGLVSPWIRTDEKHATVTVAWDAQHETETSHSRYYRWSITRNTVRVLRLPQKRNN
ncbi:hypothetical protein [Streptomyces phytophilus]|uniref:hypothetical protein n=1 Tax=Streptomyces phytophilus TaxID=722715 RepID=UPI0015F108A4|nr:hypothetical protein [Streptomyces phytophilus]